MSLNRKALFFSVIFFLIFTIGMVTAGLLNSNFGTVDVKLVSIAHAEIQLSGLLYKPKSASPMAPHPAVILTHGIASSKEYMSGIALELSRRGILSLAVDEIGHGNSGGTFGFASDPTLGILSAVRYIESLSYVNSSSIGLIGHSLGAGAVRSTSAAHGNISATVLIGGGLGEMVEDMAYGNLNATFPKNLLIAVGKQDILFDIPSLRDDLAPVFNTSEVVEPNIQYGDFSSNTARKLVLTPTIHLAEAFDPSIVAEIVHWMSLALNPPTQNLISSTDFLFLVRDLLIIGCFIAFIGFLCSFSALLYNLFDIPQKKGESWGGRTFHKNWKILHLWGFMGAILFLPMMIIGFFIPPLLFGTSIIWWLFVWGILGLLLLKFILPKFTEVVPDIRRDVINSFNKQETLIVAILIVIIYVSSMSLKIILNINFQVLTPLFGDLLPIPRLFLFFVFIPFLFVNFFADGLFFYEYYNQKEGEDVKSAVVQFFKIMGSKIVLFAFLIVILYGPLFLFDLKIIPGFLGLILEFMWGVIPIIIISSFFTDWFYRLTRSIGPGALFNALIIAWIIADTFTLGGFF
ncbi:MAG: alpha/beta hydrolase [Candidatus Heimdallarchaeota archaeon]|nr:MAG: alpha/beta hydrolase [Candidatus Heimdallarchaeota archaeon]